MQDGFSVSDHDYRQVRMVDLEYWYRPFENHALNQQSQAKVDAILSQMVHCAADELRGEASVHAKICAGFLRYCCPSNLDPVALGWVTMYLFLLTRLNSHVGQEGIEGQIQRFTACMDGGISDDLYREMDPFERELAQIFHRLPSKFPQQYLQFRHAFSLNMAAFMAESRMLHSSKQSLNIYRNQRKHTISVIAYLRFWKLLDRQFHGTSDQELVLCDYLESQAAEIQGFANDLCSINVDLAKNQGNSVLIFAEDHGLGTETASRRILEEHDRIVREFESTVEHVLAPRVDGVTLSLGFKNYVGFVRSCIAGNLYAMMKLDQRYSV